MIVAVDGPAASGKGTIGRRLAAAFGLAYLDTGAMYRAVALAALDAAADLDDERAVAAIASSLKFDDLDDDRLQTASAGKAASRVAVHPKVRAVLVERQRAIAEAPNGALLDGRDIGTVVCPDAEVKLFITASPAARAARRAAQLRALGQDIDEAELARELAERDLRDKERTASPLRPADDAILLDTTEMSIDAAFDAARRHVDRAISK